MTGYSLPVSEPTKPVTYLPDGTFSLLNCPPVRPDTWNDDRYGKLWTYTLNYFDFLNQPGMTQSTGLALIDDFIRQSDAITDGLEPYPTSLRIVNWVHFLSRHKVENLSINGHLFRQADTLSHRFEYHLGGNHLLENGFALMTAALFFRHQRWYDKAMFLIRAELDRQILPDGGHDERSPMYHQILLDRLLDLLLILHDNDWSNDVILIDFLSRKAELMLDWLNAISFRNGTIPLVNDAASAVAPITAQLLKKAHEIDIQPTSDLLSESGYRMIRYPRYELLADVGPVGPDHQPGHAHADTLSFVLHVDNQPVLIDSATSTYQPGARRTWERSTAAHNTVEVDGRSSSEVWGNFRVGQRAHTIITASTDDTLTARHDGYRQLGLIHERSWHTTPTDITIEDRLLPTRRRSDLPTSIARFYVQPDLFVQPTERGIQAGPVHLAFTATPPPTVQISAAELADGFNRLRPGTCIAVTFQQQLTTTLVLTL